MAAMTYLQLCQFAHRYLRSGNATPGSLPQTIPAGPGLDQVVYDIVDTMPRAWEWVQNEHPSWNFMRRDGVLMLTPGKRVYSLTEIQVQAKEYYGFIPFWSTSKFPYFLIYDSGANPKADYIYPFIEYQEWRGFWDRQPRPTGTQPNRMTERPDKSLEFDPTPQAAPSGANWSVKLDYRMANQILLLPGDEPILPDEFHELIAWVCIRMVCETRMNTGPLYQSSLNEIARYMDRLKARYLPQIQVDTCYA